MRPLRAVATLFAAAVVVLSLGPIGRAGEPSSKPANPTTAPERGTTREQVLEEMVRDLGRRSAELEVENRQLKARIRELEARRPVVEVPPGRGDKPRNLAEPGVPRHWVPREFNGETFYLIPLKGGN